MRSRAEAVLAGLLLASCIGPVPALVPPRHTQAVAPAPLPVETAHVGARYVMAGRAYQPADVTGFAQIGLASWYGNELRGQATANGEAFDPDAMTAAHPTLPLPSYVEVTSLDSGRSVLVRINDRGPYHGRRIIDLSMGAARLLGMTRHGARPVQVRRVYPGEEARDVLRRGKALTPGTAMGAEQLATLRSRAGWSPPPQPERATASGTGPFWALLGTFSSRHRADMMAQATSGAVVEAGGLHQVRVGPYDNPPRANAALAQLADSGYPDATIIR